MPTFDNPAGGLSRGQLQHDCLKNPIWREGPSWLVKLDSHWPLFNLEFKGNPLEQKKNNYFVISTKETKILQRVSSFSTLKFFVAFCFRFKSIKDIRTTGPLTIKERNLAETGIIKLIHQNAFLRRTM